LSRGFPIVQEINSIVKITELNSHVAFPTFDTFNISKSKVSGEIDFSMMFRNSGSVKENDGFPGEEMI